MNVRDQHIYWYHLLFQTGTFEVWDVLRGGEKCEDDEVQTARWRWRGGNGEVKTGEQGEAAKLEEARGLGDAAQVEEAGGEGKAAGWRRLLQGEAVKLEEAVDWEVKMVRWKKSQNNV